MLRKMRLELTRYEYHKILSLARLPIPTLPRTESIIPEHYLCVNTYFRESKKYCYCSQLFCPPECKKHAERSFLSRVQRAP